MKQHVMTVGLVAALGGLSSLAAADAGLAAVLFVPRRYLASVIHVVRIGKWAMLFRQP